jgi:2-oxoglutarate ferredoxin oxidoreductase subunit alpha
VRTFQAEDEIAGVGAALGAAFAGNLAVTTTSGPGVALKGETIGLAVSVELPLLIVNIQRGGPSTGLPTKTEQSDLLQAMFGRNGEAPLPIVAAAAPGDCFDAALEASRLAIKYRTPVMLLSDGYLANGAEPWRLPEVDQLPDLAADVGFQTGPNHDDAFWPFQRDPDTLARPWAIPGTAGLEHRIGGLEKADGSGNISYDPDNHHHMTELRAAKIAGIAADIPPLELDLGRDAEPSGNGSPDRPDRDVRPRLLVLGWGSSYGPIRAAVRRARQRGARVARAHLRHLNPFPANTGEVLAGFDRVLVPEMNMGQLRLLLRAEYLVDARGYNQVRGLPFTSQELTDVIMAELAQLGEEVPA